MRHRILSELGDKGSSLFPLTDSSFFPPAPFPLSRGGGRDLPEVVMENIDRELEAAERELIKFGKDLERAADRMLRYIDEAEREERRARNGPPLRERKDARLDPTELPLWRRILPTIGNIRAYIRDLEQRLAKIQDADPAQAAELRRELEDAQKILRILMEPW